jgi:type IV secretory pathway VirB2 component (pilin)
MGTGFGAITLLCEFLNLISGTIATIVAGIVIAITGIMFAVGEAKGMFGVALRILMGVGIAIGIINLGPMIGLNFAGVCGGSLGTTLNLTGA